MSIEINNISAIPKGKRKNGNPFTSSFYRKKRGIRPDAVGRALYLNNPSRVSIPKQGRVSVKKP